MKTFAMSQYATLEHLLADKSAYYEKLSQQLINFLVETQDIGNADGVYYWDATGEVVGEDIS